MIISSRTKEIIRIIVAEHGFITISDIARKMNVSERTVYREISDVIKTLKNWDIPLENVSKKGLKIAADKETLDNFMEEIEESAKIQVIEAEDRKNYIILALLHEDDFIKTEALSIDLKISLPTIRNDLKKIEQMLERQDVKLIRKKGEGICLDGTQVAKAHLLVNTIMKNVEIDILINWLDGDFANPHPFITLLEKYGYQEILIRSNRILRNLPLLNDNASCIDDWNYMECVFLIAAMVYRHGRGKGEEFFCKKYNISIENAEKTVVKRITGIIEGEFKITLSEEEITYLSWVIHLTVYPNLTEESLSEEFFLRLKVNKIIHRINTKLGINLEHDDDLMDGLLIHLNRALKRIRSGMNISNPMIREIEKDYTQLFEITGEAVYEEFPNDPFTRDEIGYLTLYFAVSLNKYAKRSVRILVVCSSGMGSSKMLASRLESEISEIDVKKVVPLIGLAKENLEDYDLVLSTIPLHLSVDQYMKVSPMLRPFELEMVKDRIRACNQKMICKAGRTRNIISLKNIDFQLALEDLNYYTRMSLDLLNDFKVLMLPEDISQKETLQKVAKWAEEIQLGISDKDIEEFYEKKKVNESYFVIPSTRVGYLECYVKDVRKPAMIVCCFDEVRREETYTDEEIKAIIMLFYPNNTIKIERQLVGKITDMLIEDADVIRLTEEGNEAKIRQIMGFRLLENIKRLYDFDE